MAIRTQKAALRYICEGRPVVVVNCHGGRYKRVFQCTEPGVLQWVAVRWHMHLLTLMGKSLFPHNCDWRYELCEF